jgi:FkbM family methyltransferase
LGTFKDKAKNLLQTLTGYKIVGVSNKLFVVVHKNSLEEIWFSYDLHLKTMFEKHRIDLVLDVGANQGQFVETVRKFYKGKILSFEPINAVFNKLRNAAAADRQWDVYNVALGSQNGSQTINVYQSSVFSSFLKINAYCHDRFGANAANVRREVVSVRRLDDLMQEIEPEANGKRIFLKMDTQGYDHEVFGGLGTVVESVVGLQTEVSVIQIYDNMRPWTESVRFFEDAGFGVIGMFPVNTDGLRVVEYDCMMINLAEVNVTLTKSDGNDLQI